MLQWKSRIERFLPGAKVGYCQQDKCDFEGNHVVLAMNDSLVARDYGEQFYNHFGLVIYDEAHHIGAPTWSKIPPMFKAAWRLGLTATPHRSDGATDALWWHLGPLLYTGEIERLSCQVKRIFFNYNLPESLGQNPSLVTQSLATKLLVANQRRNGVIIENLIDAVRRGRKVMVLSHRREKHLYPLGRMFKKLWPSDAGPVPEIMAYLGGMTHKQLLEAEVKAQTARVIFATYQMAAEGLDVPPLDTLFLTTPAGKVEQAVGRIQRKYPDKKQPIVVDFRDDSIKICKRLGKLREKFYVRKGWMAPDDG